MRLAFLYAGQGSQHVGMGKDLYEANAAFRQVLDSVDPGFDVKKICFEGPDEVLTQTQYTQPCMVAFAAGVTAALYERGIRPEMAAGLSLGEYSALCAAGVFDAKTAVDLVAFRGKAMAEAVQDRPSAMAAVLMLGREELQKCCDEASRLGVAEIANLNCPGQIVISGRKEAVEAANEKLLEAGAKRAVLLNVSGPFHSAMLAEAGRKLGEVLADIRINTPVIPYVANVTAQYVTKAEDVRPLLERQVSSSVRWQQSVETMLQDGVDTFIEIGPGKTLAGFMRKITRDVKVINIEKLEDIEKL